MTWGDPLKMLTVDRKTSRRPTKQVKRIIDPSTWEQI